MMIMLLLITRQLVIVLIAAFVLLVRSLNAWYFYFVVLPLPLASG